MWKISLKILKYYLQWRHLQLVKYMRFQKKDVDKPSVVQIAQTLQQLV